ncbi:hypothetical protein [Rufibacter roseus]|uniref:Uncharacterized protein n=1 Tax=Rufibacter roseus TaxID=1567108 RepID=A0ABW2DT80_9BACT|nr:hypothetical protein [Rufibacter roseus]
MKNSIVIAELLEELQELHQTIQQWTAEFNILEKEFLLLKKQLTSVVLPNIQRDSIDKAPAILQIAAQFERSLKAYNAELLEYVLQLDSYIAKPEQSFSVSFITTYSRLQAKLAHLKSSFQEVFSLFVQFPKGCINKTTPEQESFTQVY